MGQLELDFCTSPVPRIIDLNPPERSVDLARRFDLRSCDRMRRRNGAEVAAGRSLHAANGALTEAVRDALLANSHKASNSHLYTMNFTPIPCRPLSDFDQKTLRLKTEV